MERKLTERPKVSQQVIDLFTRVVDAQDDKGYDKYGKTIDAADGYDWNAMALEEAVDGLKYLTKENNRLRDTVLGLGRMYDELEKENKELRTQLEGIRKQRNDAEETTYRLNNQLLLYTEALEKLADAEGYFGEIARNALRGPE
ncbi:hypothetical protein PMI08_04241 [Brevibacillus sp. CF112]|uniref:hypothetical protein n=1 Tax=Brevibacillus TaxID=55080 RepID=UPI00027155A6|nr:hypothetical protein [Brevibacillus sp. CF112]EJL40774.1 hypothetical protein PMI08_04241 [Brevibacillus sp. CF112]